MKSADKNTSVFPQGDLSHAESRRRGAGGPRSVAAVLDRKGWKRVRLGDVLKNVGWCNSSHPQSRQVRQITQGDYTGEISITTVYYHPTHPVILFGDHTCNVKYIDFDCLILGDGVKLLAPKREVFSMRFLYYLVQHMACKVPQGYARHLAALKALECALPCYEDQLRIATAITSIDTHISALESLIAKYEAIKKATVNLLLKPRDGWRIVPLGEICEVCSTRRVHESDWTDSGVPFYRARELVALNEGRPITPLHISEKLYAELAASSGAISSGDLLVTGVGSIGVPYLVKGRDKFYFKDGNIIWFKNRGKIWPDYFLHAFRSDHIQKQIEEMACVGTVGSYTITNGKRTLISLPPLPEQKRIVAILDSIDGTIRGLKAQLSKTKDIKKGMMSHFFG